MRKFSPCRVSGVASCKLQYSLIALTKSGEGQLPILQNLSHPAFHNPSLEIDGLLGRWRKLNTCNTCTVLGT
jgi:hypothetical protein